MNRKNWLLNFWGGVGSLGEKKKTYKLPFLCVYARISVSDSHACQLHALMDPSH